MHTAAAKPAPPATDLLAAALAKSGVAASASKSGRAAAAASGEPLSLAGGALGAYKRRQANDVGANEGDLGTVGHALQTKLDYEATRKAERDAASAESQRLLEACKNDAERAAEARPSLDELLLRREHCGRARAPLLAAREPRVRGHEGRGSAGGRAPRRSRRVAWRARQAGRRGCAWRAWRAARQRCRRHRVWHAARLRWARLRTAASEAGGAADAGAAPNQV